MNVKETKGKIKNFKDVYSSINEVQYKNYSLANRCNTVSTQEEVVRT